MGFWAYSLRAEVGRQYCVLHAPGRPTWQRGLARILPIGFDGLTNIFPQLGKGRRALITVRIGKPFGPLGATGRGHLRRTRVDEIGHEIMRRIADLIPPEKRGHYSDDAAVREAAKGTEIYPWNELPEE